MKRSHALNRLINDVEELLAELGDQRSPEIDEMRIRVEDTIGFAKRAIANQRKSGAARLRHYAGSVDSYITSYPRLGFLTGILVGGMMGYIAGLTTMSNGNEDGTH